MRKIVILGSTGSIGTQVIDVVRGKPGLLKIVGLTTNSNIGLLQRQIVEFRPAVAAVGDERSADELQRWCRAKKLPTKVYAGLSGLVEAATCASADLVLSAVVGAVGLTPLIAAITSRKDVALANKEALVVAGDIIMPLAKKFGVKILPVDSEHSAIFQCLNGEDASCVSRILLTASGGPFYRNKIRPASIDVKKALAHPTWRMGKKITIDCSTLMNKGLEAIEAHHLFSLPLERIEIVIHPQSIVHSMVEFVDGSVIAQLSNPDMRLPIQHALLYPRRSSSPVRRLDFTKLMMLEFDRPDFKRFPCLELALEAGRTAGTMPALMNAANETAVHAFLIGEIKFIAIPRIIEKVMAAHTVQKKPAVKDILAADVEGRRTATELIERQRRS
jgi:1-deoxy-D-xylulose-5-phosphate reductoisomerase